MAKKKFQCWVAEEDLKNLDEALAKEGEFKTRVAWLNAMMQQTILPPAPTPATGICDDIDENLMNDFRSVLAESKQDFKSWVEKAIKKSIIDNKKVSKKSTNKKLDENSNKVKKARIAKGYTQQSMANLVNISRAFYNLIENGKRTPSMEVANELSGILGITIDDFYNSIIDAKVQA